MGETERARELVAALAAPERRVPAWTALLALGGEARDAVREGLGDGRWEVRRWCLYWLFRSARPEDVQCVLPLLRDPRAKVRHAALIALHCAGLGVEHVPLLIERALEDESLRVRRQAVELLALHAHPDLEEFFADLAEHESDAMLRKHAAVGRARSRELRSC
jgi:HEAT repeat protein